MLLMVLRLCWLHVGFHCLYRLFRCVNLPVPSRPGFGEVKLLHKCQLDTVQRMTERLPRNAVMQLNSLHWYDVKPLILQKRHFLHCSPVLRVRHWSQFIVHACLVSISLLGAWLLMTLLLSQSVTCMPRVLHMQRHALL